MKIGVVGATGMVGEAFINLLNLKNIAVDELRLFASDRSAGTQIEFQGKKCAVNILKPGCFKGLDVAFFSSGDEISKEWAPKAVQEGAFAIDNSAAFRMHSQYPLIVPEVNGHFIPKSNHPTIIANPNCSTIQLVVCLQALKKFGLVEVRVATYQSVSGAGKSARDELVEQTHNFLKTGATKTNSEVFPHPMAFNCLPQIGSFDENGFCSEEVKIMNETRKILQLPDLKVSAFTVRVPVLHSHSEVAWVTFNRPVNKEEIFSALESGSGLKFIMHTNPNDYPTAIDSTLEEPVFVGRVHQDRNDPNTWLMWIVADNIWKGAALNGLQIAQKIFG